MIERLAARFQALLAAMVASPHQPIVALDGMLDAESQPSRAESGRRQIDEAEQFHFK